MMGYDAARRHGSQAQKSAATSKGAWVGMLIFSVIMTVVMTPVVFVLTLFFGGLNGWLCLAISAVFSFWLGSFMLR